MIQKWWDELPHKFNNVETDEFVIMPNHVHGIISLTESNVRADLCVGPGSGENVGGHAGPPLQEVRADLCVGPGSDENVGGHVGPPLQEVRADLCVAPLPTLIQWFKTMTTNEYMRGVKQLGWSPFPGKLWHRNYYEHIIRNEREREGICQYIRDNPMNWALDRDNPVNFSADFVDCKGYLKDVGL